MQDNVLGQLAEEFRLIPSDDDFALFEHALALPEGSRGSFVHQNAVSDSQREAVVRLLRLAESESFLDRPVTEAFPELLLPEGFEAIGLEFVREIGCGGMGVVYLAWDTRLDRFVAVKVLRMAAVPRSDWSERLRREAKTVAQLDHPGIVPVYQTGTLGGVDYIVTAYIEGDTLADHIERQAADGFAAPSWHWRVAQIVGELARAVDYAHRNGVIHRDIKPSNVLIDEHGAPRLVDFGVAKLVESSAVTRDGERPGSLAYMSPEQLGNVVEPVGPASDVFELGLVLFECLSGQRYRAGSTLAELALEPDPEPGRRLRRLRPEVPRSLAAVCDRALRRSPGDRYASAAELAQDLDAAARGELSVASLSLAPFRRLWRKRRATVVASVAVLVTAGITAAIASIRLPARGVMIVSAEPALAPVHVRVRPIDMDSRLPGPRQPWGKAPQRWRMAPGLYRVDVASAEGLREYTRTLERNQRIEISVSPAPAGVESTEMVLIQAGEYTVGAEVAIPAMSRRRVAVAPFLIDRHEVTNHQYREFVLATDRKPAPIWPNPYDASWDDLPVVGVSLEDARAYAEWIGKRLPTDIEWECAAAGPAAGPYPWGSTFPATASAEYDAAAGEHALRKHAHAPEARTDYLAGVRPVATSATDVASSGMLDAFGNVAEWTESVTQASPPGQGTVVLAIVKGWWWGERAPDRRSLQDYMLADPSLRRANLGFRCAKSVFLSE